MALSFRPQPAQAAVRASRYTIEEAAERCGVRYLRFRDMLQGKASVDQGVRDVLPGLLGLPLEALFDAQNLASKPRFRAKVSQ